MMKGVMHLQDLSDGVHVHLYMLRVCMFKYSVIRLRCIVVCSALVTLMCT
jgi:hypothetical protein